MVILVKALAAFIGEMPEMRQLTIHSPALTSFRNNIIYKRMQNHNCQPRCHFNFRMSRNKGILYPLFLEHHRCQIMHKVPSWHWVLWSLEATSDFRKMLPLVVSSPEYLPGARGGSMALLASLHSDRAGNSKRDGNLRNGQWLEVNYPQPHSRELDKSTVNVLEK